MSINVDREKCIGCESCVAVCPVGALDMVEEKALINQDTCLSCGACISECPVDAISNSGSTKSSSETTSTYSDVWVYAEVSDNELRPVCYELLAEGVKLAAKTKQRCCAVLIAKEQGDLPAKLIAAGADIVYLITGDEYSVYNNDLYTNAFCELVNTYKPNAVLIGATADGRDFAPRVAARLKTGLCADCTALDATESGLIEWTRPALGGNILATILCDEAKPQMGTVRPKVFKAQEIDTSRTGEIIHYIVQHKVIARTELVRNEPVTATGACNIEEAELICAGGRGMGSADKFKQLEELAQLLGGAVGGSRAVVDEGWITHPQQVGQSGKTVTPKIYFAFGISGAIQHIAGMHDANVIIAINKDPNAPIFKVANYGIVGTIEDILPKLIEKIKAYKEA
ncbi:MAG TPA: electron transfer flavoprotein subunit alpha [Candidatus Avacidaminococcus intestinavium]|uniref:Electron transfer flavoprotein subunit alpha n=1 Tax=Candidatus Avacidaminococcus intestinavium TaxID=2840684 RepID=A0A9D1MP61_9FIRM|nr:electron transfer flavoprotein subunit alpha [Candidatus Avacidaminococcus intestinavium]